MNIKKRNFDLLTAAFFLFAVVILITDFFIVDIAITDKTRLGSIWPELFFNSLADATLLMAPCWVIKHRRTYTFIILWLATLWSVAQLLYYPTYRDVMPFSSFLLVQNVSGTLIKSTLGAVTKKTLFLLLLPLALHCYNWFVLRRRNTDSKLKRHWWMLLLSIVVFVVIRLTITTCIFFTYRDNYRDLEDTFKTYYSNLGGRHLNYVKHNGVMSYAFYCFLSNFNSRVSDEDIKRAEGFISQQCYTYSDNSFATGIEQPNLIFIMVESLNAWAVNLKIDGQEVTPTLNALAADTANIVCLNVITQAKNGRSSDGKFMYQTGLLPLLDKSVAMEFGDRTFPSITRALKKRGYQSVEICGDEGGLWNVEAMSQSYGFDTLMHQSELFDQLEANDWHSDKVIMEQAVQYLPKLRKNFVAQLFTGVMHSPYNDVFKPATWISSSKQYTPSVRNYLEKTHYFDTQLAAFLDNMKKCGLYDKCVFVIASDHSEPVDDDPKGRPALSRNGDECVLIVLNAKQGAQIKGPVGQIDVYPTILDVMGLNDYTWKGLGHSLLRNDISSVAISPDEVRGTSALLPSQRQAWDVSNILIRANWFKKK
jgi:phosphoglycerol transferase MdoB-like AlkP superfamily enzyme